MPTRNDKSVLAQFRAKLGKVPDQQIAEQAGVSRTLVVNYRKRLGIPAYQGHKAAQPAPPPVLEDTSARQFRGRRSALDEYMDVLGKLPDADIAKMAGVTAENVRTYRNRRGIAATWQPSAPAPRVEAVPAPPPAAPSPAPAPKAARARKPAAPPAPVDTPSADIAPAEVERAAAPAEPLPMAEPAPAEQPLTVASQGATVFLIVVDSPAGPRSYAILGADIADAASAAAGRVASLLEGASIRSIQRVAELLG